MANFPPFWHLLPPDAQAAWKIMEAVRGGEALKQAMFRLGGAGWNASRMTGALTQITQAVAPFGAASPQTAQAVALVSEGTAAVSALNPPAVGVVMRSLTWVGTRIPGLALRGTAAVVGGGVAVTLAGAVVVYGLSSFAGWMMADASVEAGPRAEGRGKPVEPFLLGKPPAGTSVGAGGTKPGPFKLVSVEVTKGYPNGKIEKESFEGAQSSFTVSVNEPGYDSQSVLTVNVPPMVADDDTEVQLSVQGQANWNLKSGPSYSTNMNLGVGVILYGEQKNINGDGARQLGPGGESLTASAEAVTTFGKEPYVGKWNVDGVPHRKIGARLFSAVVQSSAAIEVSFIYREER